jgi:hypothetical protein
MLNHAYEYLVTCAERRAISGILMSFLILIMIPGASAQNNTLYLMHSIPQANQLNPAVIHPCRIYISLPVISSVRQNIRTTGFGFHDAFNTYAGAQSGNYYLNMDNLKKTLRRMNYFLVNTDVDLLGFGFPLKTWNINIGISSHISLQVSYPHNIVLLTDGNWNVNSGTTIPVKINNLKVNSTAWNSIGISASKEIRKGLRVGVGVKYLNGMANINTRKSQIEVNTTGDPVTLQASINYKINSSIPLTLTKSSNGLINNVSFENATNNLVVNYLFSGNRGLSFDAGVIYDIDEATQIAASFTDLGFIHWTKNINTFSQSESIVFSGTETDLIASYPGEGDLINAIVDTLKKTVQASSATNSLLTATPFNLYGGITRELLPYLKAGAMTSIEINSGQVRPSMTLSLNFTPFKSLESTVSYTLMNNKFNQIGAGLALGNRFARFYIITDNIPVKWTKINAENIHIRYTKNVKTSLILPYNARMFSLRFGVNLFLFCDKKKNEKDIGFAKRHRSPNSKTRDACPAYR